MSTGFLSPNKIKIIIEKFPDIQSTAQKITIPGFSINPVHAPTNSNKDAWYPGDKMEFEDLIVTFIVDSKLLAYKAIKKWMKEISGQGRMRDEYFSDITAEILSNNHGLNQTMKYHYCFPYQVTGGLMDTTITEDTTVTFDCMFKYSDMVIIDNT